MAISSKKIVKPRINLTGQKFGRLLVLGLSDKQLPYMRPRLGWDCICDCGNYKLIDTYTLKKGIVKSCGCLAKEVTARIFTKNLLGKTFNRLLVLEKTSDRANNGEIFWVCLCKCGNIRHIQTSSLLNGNTQSCGCYNKDRVVETNTIHGLSKTKEYKIYDSAKRRAAKIERSPKWLTDEDWEKIRLFYLNCLKGYHVDHKIPLLGKKISGLHILGNLQYLPIKENLQKSNKFEPQFVTI